jgi:cobalamin-dependent methionine synthase I
MPDTAEKRITIVEKLLPELLKAGVPATDIYLDPLVKPISVGDKGGQEVLQTVQYIHENYPDVHTICGLSNISFGLPNRRVLNQAFTILTMGRGMDGYILDPTDKQMMGNIYAAQALLGLDPSLRCYLQAHRKGIYR